MSHTSRDVRIRRAIVVALLLAVVVGAAAWVLIRNGTQLGHDPLPCDYNCPPEGGQYAIPPATGIVLAVVLGLLLVPPLRLLGFGFTLDLGSLAAVSGWHAAVADGRLTAEAASGSIEFWRVIAIIATAIAVLGLLIEVRLPGPVWRLFGWVPAPAELRDYSGGTAVLAYLDREVTMPVREQWMNVPIRAWYPVRDPSRVRITPTPLAKGK